MVYCNVSPHCAFNKSWPFKQGNQCPLEGSSDGTSREPGMTVGRDRGGSQSKAWWRGKADKTSCRRGLVAGIKKETLTSWAARRFWNTRIRRTRENASFLDLACFGGGAGEDVICCNYFLPGVSCGCGRLQQQGWRMDGWMMYDGWWMDDGCLMDGRTAAC